MVDEVADAEASVSEGDMSIVVEREMIGIDSTLAEFDACHLH